MATIQFILCRIMSSRFTLQHVSINRHQIRSSSYNSSIFAVDVGEVTTKYEKTCVPDEWKYVERVLPPLLVPEPVKKTEYVSGWKPPADKFDDRMYYVARTRNHMMPVYLHIMQRGQKRHTIIRKIQGDIWQLEKELRPFLEEQIKPKPLRLQVDEFAGKIVMNGDFVNAIKHWLGERNY